MMGRIHKIVRQVLTSGCLTCETEESLRQLLATYYDLDDIEALTYIVSMGVIVPGGAKNPKLKAALAASAQS